MTLSTAQLLALLQPQPSMADTLMTLGMLGGLPQASGGGGGAGVTPTGAPRPAAAAVVPSIDVGASLDRMAAAGMAGPSPRLPQAAVAVGGGGSGGGIVGLGIDQLQMLGGVGGLTPEQLGSFLAPNPQGVQGVLSQIGAATAAVGGGAPAAAGAVPVAAGAGSGEEGGGVPCCECIVK